MNVFAALRALGPNIKYLPIALVLMDVITDIVEASADGVVDGTEKEAIARKAGKELLANFGIALNDETITQVINAVVAIKNALGAFKKKA